MTAEQRRDLVDAMRLLSLRHERGYVLVTWHGIWTCRIVG